LENPDQYITRVGKFLRKTSLDEIPQLWNILKGERDIIGTTKKNLDFSRVVRA
jgi:O-antigen biosynthesis protein WbqP